MWRSGFSRNRRKSKRKWSLEFASVSLPAWWGWYLWGWRMGWRACFYMIAIKSCMFWNVICSFQWGKGMTLQQTGTHLVSIHLMQISCRWTQSRVEKGRWIRAGIGGVRVTVKRSQEGRPLDFQFRLHGGFHILAGPWKAAWSVVSLTPQPDGKPRWVTAAGRLLPDGDSCEPIGSAPKRLNKSWRVSFTVAQSPETFPMMWNSFAEKFTSALSLNKAYRQNPLLIHGHHMFWAFHVSRVCVCVWWHSSSCGTQVPTGGRVRCYLRSSHLLPYVVTRD